MGPVHPREARDHPTADHPTVEEDRGVRVEDHPGDRREARQGAHPEDRPEDRQGADTSVQEVVDEATNPQEEGVRWKALTISSVCSRATPSCRF